MLQKLVILLLLSTEYILSERIPAAETRILTPSSDFPTLISSGVPVKQLIQRSNNSIQPSTQFHKEHDAELHYKTEDLHHKSVGRRKNNNSQIRELSAIDNGVQNTEFQATYKMHIKNKIDDSLKVATMPSLRNIVSNIFPQTITDIFRFSNVDINELMKRKYHQGEQISASNSQLLEPREELSHLTKPSLLVTLGNIYSIVNKVDFQGINNSAKYISNKNIPNTSIFFPNSSQLISPFDNDSPNNLNNEDFNLNKDKDNTVAPSRIVVKKIYFLLPKKHAYGNENQANVQVIQDTFEEYGQKTASPTTRRLDDFQEKVEKQFSWNNIRTDFEPISRIFLRRFEEQITNKNQPKSQKSSAQPKSLLHTYLYSSYTNNNSFPYRSSIEDKHFNSPSLQASQNIPTYQICPEESTDLINKVRQVEENEYSRQMPTLQTGVFLDYDKSNISVNHGPENEVSDSLKDITTSYHFKYPTVNEIKKLVNVHNKFVREENANLTELRFFSRPEHNNSASLYFPQINTQPSLSINPIRVAESEEPYQQIPYMQTSIQHEEGRLDPYNRNRGEQLYEKKQHKLNSYYQHPNAHKHQKTQQYLHEIKSHQQHQYLQQQKPEIYNKYKRHHQNSTQEVQLQLNQGQREQHQQKQIAEFIEQEQNRDPSKHDGYLQEHYQVEYVVYDKPQLVQQNKEEAQIQGQDQKLVYAKKSIIEEGIPFHITKSKIMSHPNLAERIVKMSTDTAVSKQHIHEEQAKAPYTRNVIEVIEKNIDRPVAVEKIIDRPVHIAYPIQVDHFIDRPYPIQIPVPVHLDRFIDRPYAVEKIIEKPIHVLYLVEKILEKPIHVPYPVEKIIEKVVEKHVPIEVERIIEKKVETIGQKQRKQPTQVKQLIIRPVASPIPVSISLPAKAIVKQGQYAVENLLELVPPPSPSATGNNEYKTIPENTDFLLMDDFNRPIDYQFVPWNHPIKRGIQTRNIKRSPDFGRNLRVEYGFKPPLIPSLEIDDEGLPLPSRVHNE